MKIIAIVANTANTNTDAPLTTEDGRCVFCGYEHLGGDC